MSWRWRWRRRRGLRMIVGRHSHSLLGDMEGAAGKYSMIMRNLDGEEVFAVTSYKWGEYLGLIDVVFDSDGRIVEYVGAPIYLDNHTAQDSELQASIEEWREPFEAYDAEVVAFIHVFDPESIIEHEQLKENGLPAYQIGLTSTCPERNLPKFKRVRGSQPSSLSDRGSED
ncbi:hypothetical protein BDZ89DRAFT_637895 [Hymenopellis radicata]|nr:hypothetical protein BDZ89DRAFT_637895 [Hymenopellis radicata]